MKNWLYKNRIGLVILFAAGLLVSMSCYLQMYGFYITFLDTDDYMRLVRIREFFNSLDFTNNVISRSNVPFGCELHWTRFYDFFIIIPAYILKIFSLSTEKSIEYVGFFISPIVKLTTVVFLFRIFQEFFKKEDAFLATVLFVAHPLILPFGSFGRPDHHAFIMLFMTIYLENLLQIIKSNFRKKHAYVMAALAGAIGIWISPETLILLLLADGVLFLSSFFDFEKLKNLHFKNVLTACFLGIIVFLFAPLTISGIIALLCLGMFSWFSLHSRYSFYLGTVGFLLLVALLPGFFSVEYDKISVVHVGLYLSSAAFFGLNMRVQNWEIKRKLFVAVCTFVAVAVMFLCAYPKFFCGMSGDIDDFVKSIWLYKVAEMRSPFQHGDTVFFLFYVGVTVLAVINKITELCRKVPSETDVLWWVFTVVAVCYTVFAGISYRMLPYSLLFSLPLIVSFGMDSCFVDGLHRLMRILITFFMTILFVFISAYLKGDVGDKSLKPHYTKQELYAELDKLSDKPVVIMAHTNDGPELLYYTKHKVVGAPYHRQTQGIISSYKVMEREYDKDIVRAVLLSTEASYIFVRKAKLGKKADNLASMIANGNIPAGMEIVRLPEKFKDVAIVKVNRASL